ncbi:choline ABC transporter ATP-binding protein [Algihabitans albus]|uniref:choline ABC transporter ATP-binding protein n=1 Tax=Algihabitans albus TaxID=2164067 RepID=UPI000E5D2DAF|nr:choline ABC transporter ATP-binding protein [Algihabitans albus]
MSALAFQAVDIVFGEESGRALPLIDQGRTRDEILEETGCVLGVAQADLEVQSGEICVLMGLSGSGKSTLLRAVNGLNRVTRGRVLVRDEDAEIDVAACDEATLRRLRTERIAMVFQQFALLPWRTVRENVGLGLELRGLPKAERSRIVAEKLELVGLDQWGDKYAHELSGGMQQRVGLARAFATDGDLLLMDEPFSALDPLIRTHLQDELLALQADLRKTILFVSHDLDEALKLGNRIAIMEGGRVVQVGRPEEIVLQPANDYVREFVAHMNPINVLRGASMMTPFAELPRQGDALALDSGGRCLLRMNGAGIADVQEDGRPLALHSWDPDQPTSDLPEAALVLAPAETTLRQVMELRQVSGRPVILCEGRQPVGLCGDTEIYRAILRQEADGGF